MRATTVRGMDVPEYPGCGPVGESKECGTCEILEVALD